jgi:hypothetical protein
VRSGNFRFSRLLAERPGKKVTGMDKFRTIVEFPVSGEKVSYGSRCLFMGSCFTEEIGGRMLRLKFPVMVNPFGTLFNPASISDNLELLIERKTFAENDLISHNGKWFSFSHYTGFARYDRQECLALVNKSLQDASVWIRECNYLLITLGTAWTYIYNDTGKLVANCHKLPSAAFTRKLMDPDEICERYAHMLDALKRINPRVLVIFTVSPVRHWKDGAVNNQLSKSILLLGIHRLLKAYGNTRYFPAYEIFMDELRDYRFYAGDMLHPSETGSAYVWERFCDAYLDEASLKTMAGVTSVLKAVSHRPVQTDLRNMKKFFENLLKQIDQLTLSNPNLDFGPEIAVIRERLSSG